jgi:PAS domain S-box-containing protein
VRTLEFRYTALNLGSPENVRFRYRLEGFDPDWIEGGNRRVAYYTNLPPDTYTFRVIGANADGVWSDMDATAVVTLEPYFSQTPAFYLLSFATLFLVIFGLHRARVGGLQARERDLARVAEERRWALEALQDSEAQFRTLFDNVSEGVYRSTPDGRIVLANRSMATLLGYESVEELLTVPARELYVDAEEHARLIAIARETGEARAIEIHLRRRDGRQVTVLESTRLLRGQGEQPAYFEGTLVDITDRKQLEEQLLQLQRIESIGRLAGSVAHDFNNLLTPILGQTDLMAEELAHDDPRRARIDQIRKMAMSARSLTRQLLAFSRRQILNRRVLDLNESVWQLQDMLRRLIGEHIDLRLRLADALAPVRVDSGQLEQVLMNLAVNARDAMTLGGTLVIETANVTLDEHTAAQRPGVRPGDYVMLGVTDTGRGISPDVRDHLFEPFVTTKRHGTGLGLSTVYGIVTQSGGHITVDSEVGKGATFRVFLPALNEAVAESETPARTAADTTGRTILLVEDDEDVRDIAREVLERAGYTVLAAEHAEDAQRIEEAHAGSIDLLLTDVVMPGLGGPALAELLRARRPDMKVLYTTGYIDDDVAHHGVLQPGVAVLEKPFTLEALLEAVQERL